MTVATFGDSPRPGRGIRRLDVAGSGVDVNGIRLHVEDHGAGTPVVLLHGWPDTAHLWRNQIDFLVSRGHRVIAPDLRGFGRSERPMEVSAYGVAQPVADGILDLLGLSKVHLVGHDWGSFVAWMTAIRHPDRVERLVACANCGGHGLASACRCGCWFPAADVRHGHASQVRAGPPRAPR